MNNTYKKFISLLMAVLMILGQLPTGAFAATGPAGGVPGADPSGGDKYYISVNPAELKLLSSDNGGEMGSTTLSFGLDMGSYKVSVDSGVSVAVSYSASNIVNVVLDADCGGGAIQALSPGDVTVTYHLMDVNTSAELASCSQVVHVSAKEDSGNYFHVTFSDDYGALSELTVKAENGVATVTAPTPASVVGYKFSGYKATGYSSVQAGASVQVSGDVDFVAEYAVAKNTVKFNDSMGILSIADQSVDYGAMAKEPTDKAVVGKKDYSKKVGNTTTYYTFKGWQLNGEDYDFFTPVEGDITLNAVWEESTVTIYFMAHTGVWMQVEYPYGKKTSDISISVPAITSGDNYSYKFSVTLANGTTASRTNYIQYWTDGSSKVGSQQSGATPTDAGTKKGTYSPSSTKYGSNLKQDIYVNAIYEPSNVQEYNPNYYIGQPTNADIPVILIDQDGNQVGETIVNVPVYTDSKCNTTVRSYRDNHSNYTTSTGYVDLTKDSSQIKVNGKTYALTADNTDAKGLTVSWVCSQSSHQYGGVCGGGCWNATGVVKVYVVEKPDSSHAAITVNYYRKDNKSTGSYEKFKTVRQILNKDTVLTANNYKSDVNTLYSLVEDATTWTGCSEGDEAEAGEEYTLDLYYMYGDFELTVNYYYEGTTNKIYDSVKKTLKANRWFSITSPTTEEDYYPDQTVVSGYMQGKNTVINVYYSAKVEYNVYYYLNGTTAKVSDTISGVGKKGEKVTGYIKYIPDIDHAKYTAVNPSVEQQTITLADTGNDIIFYYYKNVELTANSKTVTYNGTAQTAEGFEVTSGELKDYTPNFSNITKPTTTETNVGVYDVEFEPVSTSDSTKKCIGTVDQTGKYIVTEAKDGKLKINPLPVTVTVAGNTDEVTYNGAEQKATGFTATSDSSHYNARTLVTLQPGKTAVASGTNAQDDPYPMNLTKGTFTPDSGYSGSDFDVSNPNNNFKVTLKVTEDGWLKIKPAPLTVTTASATKVYDGTALTAGGEVSGFMGNEGDDATFTVTGSQTLVGESTNTYDLAFGGTAIATNYTITENLGKLKVTEPKDDPSKVITKTHDNKTYAAGETVIFTITVTNVYEEAKTITIDEIAGVTFTTANEFKNVAPGDTVTTTATYVVTEEDLIEGVFHNTATAHFSGTDTTYDGEDEVDPEDPDPKFTITKTDNDADVAKAGDVITYTITVTNTGNVTLKNIAVTGSKDGDNFTVNELAPDKTYEKSFNYTVTQADVDAGKAINKILTVTGESPTGEHVTPPELPEVPTVIEPKPSYTVEKTDNDADVTKAGDEITYTITVTNTGNVTLKNIAVTGSKDGDNFTITSLAPEKTFEKSFNYTVTQADVDAGKAINKILTVTGEGPTGEHVTPPELPEVPTVIEPKPSYTVEKTASGTPAKAGDTIKYTITVTNTGNVTLENISVKGTMPEDSFTVTSLAPDKPYVKTFTYKVTQADVDAGKVVNTITSATAKDPNGGDVKVPDDELPSTDTKITPNPDLTVTKTAEGKPTKAGDTIKYTITVTNTGNVTLKNIRIDGTIADDGFDIASLAPADKPYVHTFTYTVTQADVDAGKAVNMIVSATAKDPNGGDVEVPDDELPETETPIDPKPSFTVEKTASGKPAKAGDTIEYTITVKNTGNVTLTNIVIAGSLEKDSFKVPRLGPDLTATKTFKYIVTQADVDAGKAVNTITKAEGKDPSDKPVAEPPEDLPTVVVDIPQAPELTVTKTSDKTDKVALGEEITYTVTVENTGNVTVDKISVSDTIYSGTKNSHKADGTKLDLKPVDKNGAALSAAVTKLAPGEQAYFQAKHTVTEADILAGGVYNEATATGKDPKGKDSEVKPGDKEDQTEKPNGHITLKKEATGKPADGKAYTLGETITYKITVTNDGNLTITNTTVTDKKTGDTWPIDGEFKPGDVRTFNASYTVKAEDVVAGSVKNVATADGDSPDPKNPDPGVDPGEDEQPTAKIKETVIVTIRENSAHYIYDGTEKSAEGYDVISISDPRYTVNDFRFKGNAKVSAIYAATYPMEIKPADFVNLNPAFEKVKFVIEDGYLVIDPIQAQLKIKANSDYKIYDGTPLSNNGYSYRGNILIPGDELVVKVEGSLIHAEESTVENVITSAKVMHGNVDVTNCYNLVLENGSLKVGKRDIYFQSASNAKYYDGTPLTDSEVTIGGMDGFAPGEGASFNVTGSQTKVGSSKNTFSYSLTGRTRESDYNIYMYYGTLTVAAARTPAKPTPTPTTMPTTAPGKDGTPAATTVPTTVPAENPAGAAPTEEVVSPTPIFQLTIHYVDESGNKVADDYTAFYVGGNRYARLTPAVEGYIAETATVEGVMPQSDLELTVVYRPYSEEAAREYTIDVITEENVPLASLSADGTHRDALLPFAAMFISLLTQGWYVSRRKKYQKDIHETKARIAATRFD